MIIWFYFENGVVHIASTNFAFAALTEEGKVICWGDKEAGGDAGVWKSDLQNIREVVGIDSAFCAIKIMGKAICWGDEDEGGNPGEKQKYLRFVEHVSGKSCAFAASTKDGEVVCWGQKKYFPAAKAELESVIRTKKSWE